MKFSIGKCCGMCKNYANGFCGEVNGAYGFCQKHHENVHTSLVCENFDLDFNRYVYSESCLSLFNDNPQKYFEEFKKEEL